MVKLVDLLKRGYFPKELPPPFTTESFGSLLERDPSLFASLSKGRQETVPARHSLSRAGSLRRLLSIPNPLSFLRLSEWFEQNWAFVEKQCRKSSHSLSKPQMSSADRAVVAEVPFNQQPTHQADLRAKSRYILKTDITNCYPSIYTHSISWALHTKAEAKSRRGPSALIGNQLDKLVRVGQHGQTIGIPIGPDTSFIIAEIVLSSIDEEFCKSMKKEKLELNGFRSYDDFEFGFTTRADAERAVSILQKVLSEYELQLNPGKTTIVELPVPIESNWASELRAFKFDDNSQTWDLRRYFDRAFEFSRLNRDSEVLKYAIQRLRSVDIARKNWTLCQDLLLQCAMVEPSALPAVVDHLHFYKNKGFPLNVPKVSEVFNVLLSSHAPLGHGSEVAWALWGCLLFHLQIKNSPASAVAEMDDSVAALLLLHAQVLGLIRSKTALKMALRNWQQVLTQDGLRDSQWLLSYEANIKGWLSSAKDHVSNDAQFSLLKKHGVSFYDTGKVRSHTPTKRYLPGSGAGGGDGGGY